MTASELQTYNITLRWLGLSCLTSADASALRVMEQLPVELRAHFIERVQETVRQTPHATAAQQVCVTFDKILLESMPPDSEVATGTKPPTIAQLAAAVRLLLQSTDLNLNELEPTTQESIRDVEHLLTQLGYPPPKYEED